MIINCLCHYKQPAKLAMPVLILLPLLLLLSYGVGNIHCSTVHDNSIDRQALLGFKQGITSDPYEALSNWTMSSHFCRWNGIVCDSTRRPLRVQSLILTGKSLSGTISSSLGNLTFLNYLDLSDNNFFGSLPILGGLKQLQDLYLNNNNLSGIIPDALTNCSNLTYLDISSNSLLGSISPKFGLLSNLVSVNLADNQLNGSIPSDIGQLGNLEYLNLGRNRLSGEIPASVFILPSLNSLGLDSNMLDKASLPPNIGELLPNLVELTLRNNSFEGPIPASLGNAVGLELIDLSLNYFSGQIPISFGQLRNLTKLNLQNNQLVAKDNKEWEFLNALRNCTKLNYLGLSYNELQGPIPLSISNLSTGLQYLLLAGNSLSGQIPRGIGNLSSLLRLRLDGNNFSGTIEEWIGSLKSLDVLFLQLNNFTGSIPSFNNFTQLLKLDISGNELEGSIPGSLGNLRRLQHLNLSYNNLQGYIPPNLGNLQELQQLDLSHNHLQDAIPDISNLQHLSTLDLSWNELTGPIPDSLGRCQDLVSMQMDQNFLTGSIPVTFGNLTILSMLNLSHNNLSGSIPQSLSELKSLIKLDLSYNHLHGIVPRKGVFENATAVSLEGNGDLCGGAIILHMPPCKSDSKKTQIGYYLIRVLIPIFGFMSLVLLVYFLFLVTKMPRRHSSLTSFGENFLKVSYNDLAQATSNFSESNLIGRGSYGSVYRGKLKEPKMDVAVKVFDLEMSGGERSFLKECEALRGIQHRNLLPILTACSTVDNTGRVFKALVYEFMSNGNLDKWLHHTGEEEIHKPLSLTQRLSIAVNIADALDYLHHDCGRTTIHCDLKPSNILLDDDMNALLGDFGIASFYQDSLPTSAGLITSSVGVKGTIGYIAPEYAGGGRHAATSDDVYSFGIILLEMMTGRRPTDPIFKDGVSIVNFVDDNFPHEIFRVIDAHLTAECNNFAEAEKASGNAVHECLVSVLQVALSCTNKIPIERMDMKETASRMHAIQTSYIAKGRTKQYGSRN